MARIDHDVCHHRISMLPGLIRVRVEIGAGETCHDMAQRVADGGIVMVLGTIGHVPDRKGSQFGAHGVELRQARHDLGERLDQQSTLLVEVIGEERACFGRERKKSVVEDRRGLFLGEEDVDEAVPNKLDLARRHLSEPDRSDGPGNRSVGRHNRPVDPAGSGSWPYGEAAPIAPRVPVRTVVSR